MGGGEACDYGLERKRMSSAVLLPMVESMMATRPVAFMASLSKMVWLGLIISSTLAYAYSTSTLAKKGRHS